MGTAFGGWVPSDLRRFLPLAVFLTCLAEMVLLPTRFFFASAISSLLSKGERGEGYRWRGCPVVDDVPVTEPVAEMNRYAWQPVGVVGNRSSAGLRLGALLNLHTFHQAFGFRPSRFELPGPGWLLSTLQRGGHRLDIGQEPERLAAQMLRYRYRARLGEVSVPAHHRRQTPDFP
ncbi:MAG: hypothetical protein ACKVOX_00700 [Rhizobacter sp.]